MDDFFPRFRARRSVREVRRLKRNPAGLQFIAVAADAILIYQGTFGAYCWRDWPVVGGEARLVCMQKG